MKYLRNIFIILIFMIAVHTSAYALEMVDIVLNYDGTSQRYIAPAITLNVNDTVVMGLEMPPVIIDGSTLVPAREVFEVTGATVDWDGSTNQVIIDYGSDRVVLTVDNIMAHVNDDRLYMAVPPKMINGKTMIPVRFAAEALGFVVDWDPDKQVVRVDSSSRPLGTASTPDSNASLTGSVDTEGSGDFTNIAGTNGDMELARDISPAGIPEASYPQTQITAVNAPSGSQGHTFTIMASSPISKVDKFLLQDNRLVIDIYNAELNMSNTTFTPGSPMVSEVRVAQFAVEPEMVTRTVLQLSSAVDYSVSISPDRMQIYITFERVTVTGVSFSTDGQTDTLRISGSNMPAIEAYPLVNPDRLVIDIPYATMEYTTDQGVNGRFVSQMSAQQQDENSGRITLNLSALVKYTITYEGNTAIIKIEEPTYRNIRYDSSVATVTMSKSGTQLTAGSIQHTDMYSTNRYILTLPGDFSATYGYGEYIIHDDEIYSLQLESSGGNTRLIINERKVNMVSVTEDNENIYVKLVSPQSIYQRIVVLDAGHGGSDPGTSGNSLIEKDITLDISNRLLNLLDQNVATTGIKAYATRTDDTYISRFDRAPYANAIGDLFVSIHINSAAPNAVPNGTETYYHPHPNDNVVGITTKQTAEIFHKHLLNKLGLNDRKVKEDSYTVLVDTIMPSVLCEIAFVSNEEDAAKLGDPNFRQQVAQALYEGIVEVFSVYSPR